MITYQAGSCDVAVIGAGHAGIEAVLGAGSCHVLSIRPEGGILLEEVKA